MIGVYVPEPDAQQQVQRIAEAEQAGVPSFWLTMGGTAPDVGIIYGAAAMITSKIKLGTSIVPIAHAQQAVALNALAPGRFRLGIGPSHPTSMSQFFGVEYVRPLKELREYLTILTDLIHKGEATYEGEFAQTHGATIPAPIDVPVMASALQAGSFRLCGELSDGAISWVAPWNYLRDLALPSMKEGAAKAGRPTPPLAAHTPVFFGNREDMLGQARKLLGRYTTLPNYQRMMVAAGFDDVEAGGNPDPFLEGLVVSGSDDQVIDGLTTIIREGAGEIIVHPVYTDGDRAAQNAHLFEVVTAANKAAGIAV